MSMILADNTKASVMTPFSGRLPLWPDQENTLRDCEGGDGAAFVFLIPTYELKGNLPRKEGINRSEGGPGICRHKFGMRGRGKLTAKG